MKRNFYGIRVDDLSEQEALSKFSDFFSTDQAHSLFFINTHCYNVASENSAYKNALDKCNLLFNDGVGLEFGAKLSGYKFKENMNGTDLIPKIIHLAHEKKQKIFLLGATPGTTDIVVNKLSTIYDSDLIADHRNGYFTDEEESLVVEQINNSKASILIVGMGVPRQELFVTRNLDKLNNIKLAIAGGAILDFLAGSVRRAPKFMIKLKLEWFFRFLQEPKRLFRRYFFGNFKFIFSLLKYKFKNKKNDQQ